MKGDIIAAWLHYDDEPVYSDDQKEFMNAVDPLLRAEAASVSRRLHVRDGVRPGPHAQGDCRPVALDRWCRITDEVRQPMSYRAFIRCACGFWRDWYTEKEKDAQAQWAEWQADHARCGNYYGGVREKEPEHGPHVP